MPGQTGAPRSGYNSERDYITGLERQSKIADLTSQLSDRPQKQSVQHSYAGTDFARGRPAMSAMREAANPRVDASDSDNLDYYGRLASVQGAQTQGQRLREQAFQESTADDPHFENRRGDISREQARKNAEMTREESIKNAAAAGRAASEKYAAEYEMREQQERDKRWTERSAARERGYYDPQVEAARIKGEADVARAGADKQRERSAALKALTDLAKQQSLLEPELEEDVPGTGFFGYGVEKRRKPNPAFESLTSAREEARAVLRGLGGGEEGGGAGGGQEPLTMADIEEFAAENQMSVEEVLALAKQYGRAVR
jgi:hypothetical protein